MSNEKVKKPTVETNSAPATRARPGRPARAFGPKVAERICEKIAAGKSLRRICDEKAMPPKKIVLRWLEENPSFAAQYARAREAQADSYADELIDLARRADATNAHAIRVQVDTIKWVVSKLKPKRYGDRAALEIEAEVAVTHRTADPIELARRVWHIFNQAQAQGSEMPALEGSARVLTQAVPTQPLAAEPVPAAPQDAPQAEPKDYGPDVLVI
jgi:hypothetical protein